MAIAVVIVTFNSAPEIVRALASLPTTLETVVVDNASTDDTCAQVRAFDHVTLVQLKKNVGFARAVNLGVAQTTSKTLFLLNPDAYLPADTRAAHDVFDHFERAFLATKAAAMAPQLRNERGELQLSFGLWPSIGGEALRRWVQKKLDHPSRVGGLVRSLLAHHLRQSRAVPWVSGAAMLVRRDAFFQIGGFDPRYFLFFEDIDFCLRLWHAGHRVVLTPEFTIAHTRGASARRAATLASQAYRASQTRNAWQFMHPLEARLVAHYAQGRSQKDFAA